jgi:hypothetical protein
MVRRDSSIQTLEMSVKYRKTNIRENDDGPLPIKMKIKQEMSRNRVGRKTNMETWLAVAC